MYELIIKNEFLILKVIINKIEIETIFLETIEAKYEIWVFVGGAYIVHMLVFKGNSLDISVHCLLIQIMITIEPVSW